MNVSGGSSLGFVNLNAEPLAEVSQGADTIIGGNTTGIITSFGGDDDIRGGINVNKIHAGAGNDTIRGGSNVDTIFAGSGSDLIIIENSDFFDNVHGGTGVDTLDHSAANAYSGNDVLDFNMGTMIFNSTGQALASVTNIEIFKDNNNANNITTSAIGMTIVANGGNDQVTGLGGDDTIDGGLDNDTLTGGANTTIGDTVSFASFVAVSGNLGITIDLNDTRPQDTGAGLDTISGFENVTGSAFDDTIRGSNASHNILNGMGGNDTIRFACERPVP